MSVVLRFARLHEADSDIPLPAHATEGASGLDLRSSAALVLPPGGRAAVPTGLRVEIPRGWELQVRPRSGLALKHGVTCLNSPGTIDSDYRGEIRVILANLGGEPFAIERGDRIAQLVLAAVIPCEIRLAETLPDTDRGAGGFGSTGR